MPIFDIQCADCGKSGEVIQISDGPLACPHCGSTNTEKKMAATSTLTGKSPMSHPGPGDTACCGSTPGAAGCAGPGSCCGKNF